MRLFFRVEESYQLVVHPCDVQVSCKGEIIADTVYGALRGLETLSQWIQYNFKSQVYFVMPVEIIDKPRCGDGMKTVIRVRRLLGLFPRQTQKTKTGQNGNSAALTPLRQHVIVYRRTTTFRIAAYPSQP